METIHVRLAEVMNENEIDHHYSDLYVLKNEKSIPIVEEYRKQYPNSVSTFKCQIDNKIWYDIAFGYDKHFAEIGEFLKPNISRLPDR